jgi:hypothetical protein
MQGALKYIKVVCPRCGNKTQQEIGWLKGNATFRCERPRCGGLLHYNINELNEFIRNEPANFDGEFVLKRYPEDSL